MSVGPITIFDKSALQALSLDEAVLFDDFYLSNIITPLFLVETLADREKIDAKRRPPEQVVGDLAAETPLGGRPSVHHVTLCAGELLGYPVELNWGRPVIAGARPVATSTQTGIMFDQAPEAGAMERWQRREFLETERPFARGWRRALSGLDLQAIYEKYRPGPGARLRDLPAAKDAAAGFVHRDGHRFAMLKVAMGLVDAPPRMRQGIVPRWKRLGGPALPDFAPYTAHVMTVDMFFNLAIGADLIGPFTHREHPNLSGPPAYKPPRPPAGGERASRSVGRVAERPTSPSLPPRVDRVRPAPEPSPSARWTARTNPPRAWSAPGHFPAPAWARPTERHAPARRHA